MRKKKHEILIELNWEKLSLKEISKMSKFKSREKAKTKKLEKIIKKNKIKEKINDVNIIEFIKNYNSMYYFQKIIITKEKIVKQKDKEFWKIINNNLYNNWEKIFNIDIIKEILNKKMIIPFIDWYYKKYLKFENIIVTYKKYMELIQNNFENIKIDIKDEKYKIFEILDLKTINIKNVEAINIYLKLLDNKMEYISHKEIFNVNHTRNQDKFIAYMMILDKTKFININNILYKDNKIFIKYDIEQEKWKNIIITKKLLKYKKRNNDKKYIYLLEILGFLNKNNTYTTSYKKIQEKLELKNNKKTKYKINLFLKEITIHKIIQNFKIEKEKIYLYYYKNK